MAIPNLPGNTLLPVGGPLCEIRPHPNGYGVELVLAGQSVPELRGVTFHCAVGSVATITADVLVHKGFALRLPSVNVNLQALVVPGYRLIVEERDGQTVYRTEAELLKGDV